MIGMPASSRRSAQVGGLSEPVGQVGFVQAFPQADGHGVQIASGQPAVGGEAFAQDQLVADAAGTVLSIVHRQEAADVDDGILLGAHPGAVGQGEHLARDLERWFCSHSQVRAA